MSLHKKTGVVCAIKKIFKSTIREYGMQQQLLQEIKIHYFLEHPNIVQLWAHFDDQYHIFLVMECAPDDCLLPQLPLPPPTAASILNQLVPAVA